MAQHITSTIEAFPVRSPQTQVDSTARAVWQELDGWSRDQGWSWRRSREVAARAASEAHGLQGWQPARRHHPQPVETDELPRRLRQWPAQWRYRVAALETQRIPRRQAMRQVRQEHRSAAAADAFEVACA